MKLEKPITLVPSKYTDQSGEVITPQPVVLDELNIVYLNRPKTKQYYIAIEHVPTQITLFQGKDYKEDITLQEANAKFLELTQGNIEHYLQNLFPRTLEDDPYGPGSILASMFSAIGIKSTPTCSCRRHALEMNKNGIEWCENNLETICGWLQEECKKRHIPYVDAVARMVVNRAINKAKKYRENPNAKLDDNES